MENKINNFKSNLRGTTENVFLDFALSGFYRAVKSQINTARSLAFRFEINLQWNRRFKR